MYCCVDVLMCRCVDVSMCTQQNINTSTRHQHINKSTHQHINTMPSTNYQHISTVINTSTQHIDTSAQSSTHQHINTSTSTHQHIDTSMWDTGQISKSFQTNSESWIQKTQTLTPFNLKSFAHRCSLHWSQWLKTCNCVWCLSSPPRSKKSKFSSIRHFPLSRSIAVYCFVPYDALLRTGHHNVCHLNLVEDYTPNCSSFLWCFRV
jgi:hypothetical protein